MGLNHDNKQGIADKQMPSALDFENELIRVRYKQRYTRLLRNTVYTLLVVAAISVLIATLLLPVLEIYGSSMTPTLQNGDIVISIKTQDPDRGDICCFYYNNHLLVKRVIGLPGDIISMDDGGVVSVNGEILDEPYLERPLLGQCDLTFPYTVPEQSIFVLGDNRETSVDSRNLQIGCIPFEEIVGVIVFRIWPLPEFGTV